MPGTDEKMRWGVERRLEFVDFRLFWEGRINRADITSYFGVSTPQASKDLSQYQELAPQNVAYNKRQKRYVATNEFSPRFMTPDADRYLSQLAAIADHNAHREETWLTDLPAVDTMPVPRRRVSVDVLRAILNAIRERSSLEVHYQSMSSQRTAPLWRRITPHAFGSDGFRWHVRAYCHIDLKFKDFLLPRCVGARDLAEPGSHVSADAYWNEHFDVVLAPNPKLGPHQQKIIEQDYEMSRGSVSVPVRKALLYYFSKRLRLDVADHLDKPHETPVIVKNRAAFDAALAEAMS